MIMFQRIFLCCVGSVAFWITLLLLLSEPTPQGTTRIRYIFLYLDSFLAVVVLVASLVVFVFPLITVRAVHARPAPAEEATGLVQVSQDVERWQQPTTVGILESHKAQLRQIEARVRYLEESERRSREFYKEDPGALAMWLCERGLSMLRKQCWKESGTAESLRQTISRLYAGDADFEVRNLREQICQLQDKRARTEHESLKSDYDKSIRFCQRQIDELEQWSKKVTAQARPANDSSDEIAWRNFLNDLKRTAALPIAQASSRVEAALAGIEARRFYQKTATERWQRGALTDREFEFIKKRIDEAFLGDSTSIYA
jgi:hypothetical protein